MGSRDMQWFREIWLDALALTDDWIRTEGKEFMSKDYTDFYVGFFTKQHQAEKAHCTCEACMNARCDEWLDDATPGLQVGDTVRITCEEYRGQVGELRVIDTIAFVGDCYGVYLDSIERIEVFFPDELVKVSPEQALLDAAVARAIALGRPFTEDEVLTPAWKAGCELTPEMVPQFALYQEAKGKTRRLWCVVDESELPF